MPDYPEPAAAIQTDIRLFSTDIMAFSEGGTKDLVVRTTLEPQTSTCTVAVYVGDQPGGGVGRLVAQRTIFTRNNVTPGPVQKATLSPELIDRVISCEGYATHGETCEKCGFNRADWTVTA
jgi:hypothetical protein